MAKTTITLTHANRGDYKGTSSMSARRVLQETRALLDGASVGAYGATSLAVERQAQGTVTLSGGCTGVAASGTVTLGGEAGDVTIVVDGTSVGPVPFNGDDAQTAADCITALNADSTFAAKATASDGGAGIVDIVWDTKGTVGNAKTLTASRTAGSATASGATLAGGVDAATATVDGTLVKVGPEGSDDAATAVLLAAAINADGTANTKVSATASGTTVTLTALDTGAGGDAYTLTATAGSPGSSTVSGATLAGGAATTYTF